MSMFGLNIMQFVTSLVSHVRAVQWPEHVELSAAFSVGLALMSTWLAELQHVDGRAGLCFTVYSLDWSGLDN